MEISVLKSGTKVPKIIVGVVYSFSESIKNMLTKLFQLYSDEM